MDTRDERRTIDGGGPAREGAVAPPSRRIPAALWNARVEAQGILAAAREEARALVAIAAEEARRLRDEAVLAAAGVREEATGAGLAEGRSRAAAELLRGAAERESILRGCAGELLGLAVDLAASVLHREVRPTEDTAAAVQRALESLRGERSVIVRVSPGEAAMLGAPDGPLALRHGLQVVADPDLSPGEVVIHAAGATVDGRFRAGLQELLRRVAEAEEEEKGPAEAHGS